MGARRARGAAPATIASSPLFAAGGREPPRRAETRLHVDPTAIQPQEPGAPSPASPAVPHAAAGELVLGRYRLARRLGAGGFGAVFVARDETLGRDVAVKVVPRATPSRARAEREAIVAARLNHPGIVTLFEAGSDADAHYLVSELVSGATLGDLIAAGALSDRDVVRVGLALCDALAHAHERGVIHRDVKPQNVIVPARAESAAGVAKLTDFGVARLVGDDPLTRTGDVIGTLAYMAPEQAEGRESGEEADLYALSLVLYEALSGHNPVRAAGPAATARRVGAAIPSLRRARRGLPTALTAAIDRGLRARPDQRGDLEDLREALEAALPRMSDANGAIAPDPDAWEAGAATAGFWRRRGATVQAPPPQPRFEPVAGELAWPYDEGEPAPVPAPRRRLRARARLGAALGAGGVAIAAAAASGVSSPSLCLTAALAAAALVFVAPRLGWMTAATLLVGWIAVGTPDRPGAALLVAAALVPVPVLLVLRRPAWWSVPVLAPGLGFIGLAGGFPVVAGMARGWWTRAALGALGFWALALAEPLAGRTLAYGRAAGTLAPGRWSGSLDGAVEHALRPLLQSGPLVGALVWAAAAVGLPWLVRGRSMALDLLGATAWVALLVAAAGAAGRLPGVAVAHSYPRGMLAGAALGGVAAVLLRAARRGPAPDPVP